jgi:hypothetical protein
MSFYTTSRKARIEFLYFVTRGRLLGGAIHRCNPQQTLTMDEYLALFPMGQIYIGIWINPQTS